MGFNFRKSLKIAPGVRINITKKGVSSLSVGKSGARVNIGKKGIKTTAGLPGTGLSYSKFSSYGNKKNIKSNERDSEKTIGFGSILLIGVVLLFLYIVLFG
ncbi:MAG: DUF4236 domain-containing protein [Moraxellaceae bacterium]|uniref:DUF4236 domain-containing protein n=1 Tax=Acinetobacter tjernbergiae DSM 14971 = CIP 107465 TaxID=1120928 RepID=V2UWH0_9GAMM|nr:DUF4236 domain-containing protein [Acinetobacter tjernbergiae]ESK54322.1 hypothetical protein F990_02780 [Acinetobacter tjernbergiae DSM 14971 = CIP 107465]MBH2002610.1 DUF4236 domain-containing protein [Moraxellaceae bacterium]